MYLEIRPETLGLLIELDRQSKPLIIDTEHFVKNTDFRRVYCDSVNLRAGAVDHLVATKFLLNCKESVCFPF